MRSTARFYTALSVAERRSVEGARGVHDDERRHVEHGVRGRHDERGLRQIGLTTEIGRSSGAVDLPDPRPLR
jgi:hypothetical protein